MNSLDINMEFFIIPKFKKTFQRSQIQCEGILSACEAKRNRSGKFCFLYNKKKFFIFIKREILKGQCDLICGNRRYF